MRYVRERISDFDGWLDSSRWGNYLFLFDLVRFGERRN